MGSEDEDVTFKLADDLLRRIVSFLPIKDALRMSVLSTRWRYMWTCVSKIDLDNSMLFGNRPRHYQRCGTSFLHLVDRLLLGHDDSDITRFKVSCDVPVDDIRVQSWISSVINHNVEELDLRFPLVESCILPSCLFSSQSLTILSINSDGELEFPSSLSVGCPCLKSLNLSNVVFTSEDNTNELFSDLSSIFPSLQQLSLVRCEWINVNDIEITSSSLKSITIDIYEDEILDCEVVIRAPKLAVFHCKTDCSINMCLTDPNLFMDASLKFYPEFYPVNDDDDDEEVDGPERLGALLGEMRNSIRLTLSTETLSASRSLVDDLPEFENLTYLNISGSVLPNTIGQMLDFMEKTPNLEYLSISLYNVGEDRVNDWWSTGPAPSCLMKKLKKLKVSGLDAVNSEMLLINYFLKHACILEEIQVCAHKRNAKKLEKFRNELVALPRSSKECAFTFEVLPDSRESVSSPNFFVSPRPYVRRDEGSMGRMG